jgi:NAD(P)-dependent dehydrogenase (short-subunit alcohol dehydrogenase family)
LKFPATATCLSGFGEPADVANAAVFLASPLAKFITGSNLDLGGTLRGLI